MKPTNCGRYTFELGGRAVKYDALRNYVCNECGGAVTHSFPGGADRVACAKCGGEDIITESRYMQQIAEGWEVMAGLPEYLQEQMKGQAECQSATEATDDLSV
jgi:DNA-directed RNA polymerase subunit RPC12/RpoP